VLSGYEYPHPAVTVEIVIFTIHDGQLKLLLIRFDVRNAY
jgi:hypothetical protein